MTDKADYYIEFWNVGDRVKTPEGATFSIRPKSLNYFLNRLIGNGKRTIVYLKNCADGIAIIDRRNI